MRPHDKIRGSDPGPQGPRRWLARGVLLAGLALSAVQPALGDMTGTGGGSESIGSLPSKAGPDMGTAVPTVASQPFRLVLVGREAELRALIVDARGQGWWQLTPLEAPGSARLVFEGTIELVLDRRALERSFVSCSIELGAPFGGGAVLVSAGGLRSVRSVGSPRVDLHLQQLSWTGLLDDGVVLQAVTPALQTGRLTISATPDRVVLVQQPQVSP